MTFLEAKSTGCSASDSLEVPAGKELDDRWVSSLEKATWVVFALAALSRLSLAFVNTQANDDHVAMIATILFEQRFPGREDAWEGFQPKFYHLVSAQVSRAMEAASRDDITRVAQIINALAGCVTLLTIREFLRGIPLSSGIRLLSFSLVALNPGMVGINAQATNDTFVILFGTLSLYYGYNFFRTWSKCAFAGLTLAVILASISKGNGLVVAVAVAATLCVILLKGNRDSVVTRKTLLLYTGILGTTFIVVVANSAPYWHHWKQYGSPFVTNVDPAPLPDFAERTYPVTDVGLGVTSILDGYFTFRLLDLLRYPTLADKAPDYPLHRTSVWTQLYGSAYFAHFDAWPPAWQLKPEHGIMRFVGRAIFVLALLPTLLLVVGILRTVVSGLRWALDRSRIENQGFFSGDWLMLMAALGYVAFVVSYSLQYRDYTTMKAIFLFPALLAFSYLFATECERSYATYLRTGPLRTCATTSFIALITLSGLDAAFLLSQLTA